MTTLLVLSKLQEEPSMVFWSEERKAGTTENFHLIYRITIFKAIFLKWREDMEYSWKLLPYKLFWKIRAFRSIWLVANTMICSIQKLKPFYKILFLSPLCFLPGKIKLITLFNYKSIFVCVWESEIRVLLWRQILLSRLRNNYED